MEKHSKFIPLLFLLSVLGATQFAAAATSRTIYLAPRTDGLTGTGTQSDPVNVSTTTQFDAFWTAQHTYATAVPGGIDNAVFYLASGNYTSLTGIKAFSGWSLIGAGQDLTKISLVSTSTGRVQIISDDYSTGTNVTIEDMTLDGGVTTALSASLTRGFNVPAAGKTVTISVSKSSLFAVKGYAFLQGLADSTGFMAAYGVFTVTAIPNGTSITIRNDSPSGLGNVNLPVAAKVVPSGVNVILPCQRVGLTLAYKNITVDNVTIQNVIYIATGANYEGPTGIIIGADHTHNGSNNQITNCTLKGIYGTSPLGIYLTGDVTSTTAWAQCDITGCTITGGGWYQGIGGYQMRNCIFSGNHVSNFPECFYADSGSNSNITISNNVFTGGTGNGYGVICFNGNPFFNSAFSGNTIISTNNGADVFVAGNVSNNTFSRNQFLGNGFPLAMGDVKAGDVMKGNYFSNNVIGTALSRSWIASTSYGSELGNVVQGSNTIVLLGLTNLNGSSAQVANSTAGSQSVSSSKPTPATTAPNTTSTSSSSTSSSSTASSGNSAPTGSVPTSSSSTSGTIPSTSLTASTVWLASRTDGIAGLGTQTNPLDVSTAAKFDAFFASRYAAHFSNFSSYDPATFQFLSGSYSCSGINAMSGWHLVGSGQSTTVIHLTADSYASDSSKSMNSTLGISCSYGARDIQVKNLTLDGGVRATGIPVSTGFTMPSPRESVEVTVSNPAQISLEKWYYVQDTAMTNGVQKWWGIMTCTAINGSTVTLQNAEVAAAGTITGDITAGSPLVRNVSSTADLEEGQKISNSTFAGGSASIASVDTSTQIKMTSNATTTANGVTLTYSPYLTNNGSGQVPATAYLFPAGSRSGISLQSNGIQIENVTVQDVSMPLVEGPVGIAIVNSLVNQTVGSSNIIEGCTVKDVFGIYGDYISANNNPGTNGITEQVNITNNTVSGNGYSNGIELAGIFNSAIAGNTISNVNTGLSCIAGDNASNAISANSFSGASGIYFGVASPGYLVGGAVRNNVITLTSSNGTGIELTLNTSNVTISNNIITIGSAGNGSEGIAASNLSTGANSNTIINNQIASSLSNDGIDAGRNQSFSSNQIQQNVSGQTTAPNAQIGIPLQVDTAAILRTDPGSGTTTSLPLTSAVALISSIPSIPTTSDAQSAASDITSNIKTSISSSTSDIGTNALVQRLTRDVALMEAISAESTLPPTGGSSSIAPNGKTDPTSSSSELQQKKLLAELDALINQIQADIQK
jgi:hypothetical protein